ncbi:MAG: beta-N-acetylhexosaminidase [Clostridiales bacterium]|nr:beta-N-acetylhexosaminidase [Clostridiales bacterium]
MEKMNKIELSIMLDVSRNAVMKPSQIKSFVDHIAAMGYSALLLYTEDTYEIDGEPYFGFLRGKYTKEELKEIDAYCVKKGIELIPCIQTLAHLNGIFHWPIYEKIHDCADLLLVGEEQTYALIEKMLQTCKEVFTSNKIHLGMDETHNLGKGKYFKKNGYKPAHDIFNEHFKKVLAMAEGYGYECYLWSDMYFCFANNGTYAPEKCDEDILAEAIAGAPKNATMCYWEYYADDEKVYDKMLSLHKKYFDKVLFTGCARTEFGYVPLNKQSIKIAETSMRSVLKNGVDKVMVTCWGDGSAVCSFYSALPTILAYAEFAKGNFDWQSIKDKFYQLFGMDWDTFMLLDLPNEIGNPNMPFTNPSSYMLYNDFFVGTFDCTVKLGDGLVYKGYAKRLKPYRKHKDFGYIFDLAYQLCSVMDIKYELGVKTRNAYLSNDKKTLKSLALNEYTLIQKRLNRLFDAVARLWETENKTTGAEIEDIKLGGIIQRAEHCKKLLLTYVKTGKEIPELSEKMLDFYGGGYELSQKPIRCFAQYYLSVSPNRFYN